MGDVEDDRLTREPARVAQQHAAIEPGVDGEQGVREAEAGHGGDVGGGHRIGLRRLGRRHIRDLGHEQERADQRGGGDGVEKDGSLHAFVNRCAHRGSLVCAEGRGNTERFVCPYHGWSYDRAGTLQAVPFSAGYEKDKLPKGLKAVPRVSRYRGFIFASLAETGPTLEEFLGPAKASFDDFVDRAPGGELEVAGGVFKHAYNGNWKLMLENHLDGAHPAWVHASSVAVARNAPDPGKPGEEHYSDIAVRQMRQNGAPDAVWEGIGMWTTARGHGYMGDYHDDSRLVAGLGNPVFEDYRARLVERFGVDPSAWPRLVAIEAACHELAAFGTPDGARGGCGVQRQVRQLLALLVLGVSLPAASASAAPSGHGWGV